MGIDCSKGVNIMDYFTLNDGIKVPAIGFGTYKITEEKDMDLAVETALKAGYTYFDTAKFYENEDLLGKYLKNYSKNREDYKIATKIWPNAYSTDKAKESIDVSLKDLGVDYLDVALLHWYGQDFREAWKVLNDYKDQGIIKSIGVCNFSTSQMSELLKEGTVPVLDQLESHLHLQDKKTHEFLKENKILHQAWGPLAQGKSNLLDDQVLKDIGKKYNKTPAQIALKWNIERGVMVLVKSSNEGRIYENIDIFDFNLTDEDMDALSNLDKNKRYSGDPEDKEWLEKAANM